MKRIIQKTICVSSVSVELNENIMIIKDIEGVCVDWNVASTVCRKKPESNATRRNVINISVVDVDHAADPLDVAANKQGAWIACDFRSRLHENRRSYLSVALRKNVARAEQK